MAQPIIPVRLTPAHALHLASPTGSGYMSICGRRLAGEDVQVPMPRFPRSRRHVEAHWAKCWDLERVCLTCNGKAEKL